MSYFDTYYKGLEGATILHFLGMDKDPHDLGDGFPVFRVKYLDGHYGDIAISQDPEGNGGGFIFGIPEQA